MIGIARLTPSLRPAVPGRVPAVLVAFVLAGAAAPAIAQAPRPDLSVSRVSGPAAAVGGAPIVLSNVVGNAAGASSAAGFTVLLVLSGDATADWGDVRIATRFVNGLAPGAVSEEDTPVTVPVGAYGTFHLGAVVDVPIAELEDMGYPPDPNGDILESDETNNTLTGNVIVIPFPDVRMTALSAPASAPATSIITITDAVTNDAAGSPTTGFRIGYYLSTDATITKQDTYLGWRNVPSLAPGATNVGSTPFTLPVGKTGTFYVGAIADSSGSLPETDETNNIRVGNAIDVVPALDLVAGSVVVVPSPVPARGTISVSNSVFAATASTGPFDIGLYLSTDASVTTSDLRIGSRHVDGLAANATSTATTSVALPEGISGHYRIGAIVDDVGNVTESNETNNTSFAYSIFISPPDLAMSSVAAATSAAPGGPLAITDTVTAPGGGAGAFQVDLYLSVDATITTDDFKVGSRSLPDGLLPGDSSTGTTECVVPTGLTPGTYYLGAIADGARGIPESDETNNALAGSAVTIGAPVAPPDLVAAAVAGSPVAVVGQRYDVSFAVSNRGASLAGASSLCVYLAPDGGLLLPEGLLAAVAVGPLGPGADVSGTVEATVPPLLGGPHRLYAVADCGGDVVEANEQNGTFEGGVVTVVADAVPPELVLLQPLDGLVTAAGQVQIVASASDDTAIAGVSANGTVLQLGADGLWRATLPLLDGTNVFDVVASDTAGRETQRSVMVRRDSQPPLLVVTSPAEGLKTGLGAIAVLGNVVDGTMVTVRVGGEVVGVTDGPFAGSVALVPGENSIVVTATDEAGNASSTTVRVLRSASPLMVAVDSPPQGFAVSAPIVSVGGRVTGGVPPVRLTVNGFPAALGDDGSFRTTADVPIRVASVIVRATDAAGAVAEQIVTGWRNDGSGAGGWCEPNPGVVFLHDAVGNLTQVVDTASDPENCGCAGHRCPGSGDLVPACSTGLCGALRNGEWVDLSTDPSNCGAPGNACRGLSYGAPTCANGVCGVACDASYLAVTGRCVDLTSDVEHCGFAGNVCPGAELGVATCTNGLCGEEGAPVVSALNGVSPPGRIHRMSGWLPIRMQGIGLEKVTRVEAEDWGADTVGEGVSDPGQTGNLVAALAFLATPTEIYLPPEFGVQEGNGLWGERWYKLNLYYSADGVEQVVAVDVAFSLAWDPPAEPPWITGVSALRSHPIRSCSYDPEEPDRRCFDYDPATGFIATVEDLTALSPQPVALLGGGALQAEYPIHRVTSAGVYLRAGISDAESARFFTEGGAEWFKVASFVYPFSNAPDEVIHLGMREGGSGGLFARTPGGFILRGAGFFGGALALSHPVGNWLGGEIYACDYFGDRAVVRDVENPLHLQEAFVELVAAQGAAATPWPLRLQGAPIVREVAGQPLEAESIVAAHYGSMVILGGQWFSSTTHVVMEGLDVPYRILGDDTLEITLRWIEDGWCTYDPVMPAQVVVFNSECLRGDWWECSNPVVFGLTDAPPCPPGPPPDAPPDPPVEPPTEGVPPPVGGPGGEDCSNRICGL